MGAPPGRASLKVRFPGPDQATVVLKVDNTIHWIILFPMDKIIGFPNIYPKDSAIQLLNDWGYCFNLP